MADKQKKPLKQAKYYLDDIRSSMLSPPLNAIKKCVTTSFSGKYLLYTNTGISVIMSLAGDAIQQNVQISKKEIRCWNRGRSRDVALFGFIIGPACHYWYLFLDKWLPGRSFRTVAKKIVLDQCICSPIAIGSFLIVTSYFEGKRNEELKDEVLHKGWTLYKAEWFVWPPAQTLNFFLLPTKYRVLFDNTVSFCFDWYYSYVKYGTTLDKSKSPELENVGQNANDELFIANIRHPGSHLPPLYVHNAVIDRKHASEHRATDQRG